MRPAPRFPVWRSRSRLLDRGKGGKRALANAVGDKACQKIEEAADFSLDLATRACRRGTGAYDAGRSLCGSSVKHNREGGNHAVRTCFRHLAIKHPSKDVHLRVAATKHIVKGGTSTEEATGDPQSRNWTMRLLRVREGQSALTTRTEPLFRPPGHFRQTLIGPLTGRVVLARTQ